MPGSPKWSLSLRFPHQNPVYTSPLPHKCYMPLPPHSSQFDHPKKCTVSTAEHSNQTNIVPDSTIIMQSGHTNGNKQENDNRDSKKTVILWKWSSRPCLQLPKAPCHQVTEGTTKYQFTQYRPLRSKQFPSQSTTSPQFMKPTALYHIRNCPPHAPSSAKLFQSFPPIPYFIDFLTAILTAFYLRLDLPSYLFL